MRSIDQFRNLSRACGATGRHVLPVLVFLSVSCLHAQLVPPPIVGRTTSPVIQAVADGSQRVTFEYGVRVAEGERHRGYIRTQWDFDPYVTAGEGGMAVHLNARRTVLQHQDVNYGLGALTWGFRMMEEDDEGDIVESISLRQGDQVWEADPANKRLFRRPGGGVESGPFTVVVKVDQFGAKAELTFTNPETRLRFHTANFHEKVTEMPVGVPFGIELRLPNDPDAAKVDRVTVALRTQDKEFGTPVPRQVELVETSANSAIFRTAPGGVLPTFDEESKVAPFILTIPGDRIHARYGDVEVGLEVRTVEPVPDDNVDHEEALYRLEWVEDADSLDFRPGAVEGEDALRVRLVDEEGEPIPGVVLRWTFDAVRLSATSLTDQEGVAELAFALKPNGSFAVLTDGNELADRTLGGGRYAVTVKVDDADLDSEVGNTPLAATATLTRPVLVNFLNRERGGYVSSLLSGEGFQLEVHDLISGRAPAEITAQLSSARGNLEATLYRYVEDPNRSAYYLTERSISAYDGSGAPSSPRIVVPPGGLLTARYGSASVAVPVYETWLDREIAEIRAAIACYESLYDESGAEVLEEEALARWESRRQLLANARLFLDHPDLQKPHRLFVGAAYLELLGRDADGVISEQPPATDLSRLPSSSSPAWNDLAFTNETEAAAAYEAIRKARAHTLGSLGAIPGEISTATYEAVKNLPQMLASPVLSGYTVWTGLTLDGQRATTFERTLGGVDVAFLLLPVARIAPLARAGRALRANVARVALREAEAAAASITETASRQRLLRQQAILDKRMRWKAANEGAIARHQAAIANLEREIAELRQQIDTAVRQHRPRSALREQLAAKQTTKHGLRATVDELIGINQRHKALIAKKAARIEMMRRAELSPEVIRQHLADGTLPPARARVNGRSCHWQFEQQVNRDLAGEGFTPGKKMGKPARDAAAYQPPHSGPGPIDLENLKPAVRRPNPDHMNTATFDIADSKFYDFARGYQTKEMQFAAAKTIVDTAEKATMYQRWLARQAFAQGSDEAITKIVLNSRIRIYTPGQIPWDVKNLIRKLVGPRNAARIDFHVAPARLAEWAAQ